MTGPTSLSQPLRVSSLSQRKPARFDLRPSEAERQELADRLGILAIPALRFTGEVRADGRRDFALEARLDASVEQACVVTLVPVKTRIDESVKRRYLADYTVPEGDEAEMPEDDTQEPLGQVIDPGEVMIEALALALPDYPRAPGVEPGEIVHAGPGVAPLRDSDLKPFAGLATLADRLRDGPKDDATDKSGEKPGGKGPKSGD